VWTDDAVQLWDNVKHDRPVDFDPDTPSADASPSAPTGDQDTEAETGTKTGTETGG